VALAQRLDAVRGKHVFDAIVGLSGGKDSVYVLNRTVSDFGLNVLALTFDNGCLKESAAANIQRAVEKLGVQHEFYRPDQRVHRAFYQAAFRTFGDPCIACAIGGYCVVLKICLERRIPFFIHGRSPYQMFRNFYAGNDDIFTETTQLNIEPPSIQKLIQFLEQLDERVGAWLEALFGDPVLRERVRSEFFLDPNQLTPDFAPEFLGLFAFEPYDEEHLKQVAEAKLGYRRPKKDALLSHDDCKIHDASAYLFHQIHGETPALPEIAAMLRHGALTMEEGRHLVEFNTRFSAAWPTESMNDLCDLLELSTEEIRRVVEEKRRGIEKFECH